MLASEKRLSRKFERKLHLVDMLERRDGLALGLVEGLVDDATVLDVDLRRVDVVLPRECVLHPVLIITLRLV